MIEIVKEINDTNASYRALTAGDAKNTDLFLDNEHYKLFEGLGDTIRVRFSRENLTQAILFIASILPRKYDCSSIHMKIDFSEEFVLEQLNFLARMFSQGDGKFYIQTWNIRKDVPQKNGEIDTRFYFKGLLSDIIYKDNTGKEVKDKFTIRNYLAGGYSKLHIQKGNDGVFDVRIENALTPRPTNEEEREGLSSIHSLQKIFFGTPGSGKSHRIKTLIKGKKVHRTTFHPDSDYASVVGCYKPTMIQQRKQVLTENELKQKLQEYLEDGASYPVHRFAAAYPEVEKVQSSIRKEWLTSLGKTDSMDIEIIKGVACAKEMQGFINLSEISYSFIPQVFTEAYIDAWTHPGEEVYLVIEEINRGNCAQIFGDLFQLLDRKADGTSDYRIKADSDLRDYLYDALKEENEGIKGGELCLPPNLRILATMNTSDQSLFPIDSAFKRRWDWEYVPVDYSDKVPSSRFTISLGNKKYRWVEFLRIANERIRKATDSEDKQMGNFFIKNDVSEAEFKSKVMFYLWNEVCRDEYGTPNNFFRSKQNDEGFEFSFNDLYQANGPETLQGFMTYLGVEYTTEEQEPKDSEQEA